jgi:predicted TIM-barrel fold metal-dependent hydrolase
MAYSGDNRLLPRQYDVAAFVKDTQGVEVLRSVNIEGNPEDPVSEVRWLQSLTDDPANRGHPHGIVAYADLSRSDAPQALERLAGYPNVRGIRQILNVHADPRYNYIDQHCLADRQWRENLRLLGHYGWSFDLQLYPAQAAMAAEVVQANPDTQFIVNHAGMYVDRDDAQGWDEWCRGLRVLAVCENTAIKLSGLAMFDHSWTVESFRPLVLEAIERFGVGRCMFASNFPIDGLHRSYTVLWEAYAQIVSGMRASQREDLFIHNAIRYYRLPPLDSGELVSDKT